MPTTIANKIPHAIILPMYVDITQNHLHFTFLFISLVFPPPAIGVLRNKQNNRYKPAIAAKNDMANFNNIIVSFLYNIWFIKKNESNSPFICLHLSKPHFKIINS